ncbi:MAG: class I SAM-dependent methyltransferase [Omnitrophica bacterium]|nr:class I SAM-dependent methyltransferase [Candidatus Omnitrophota bacterium]
MKNKPMLSKIEDKKIQKIITYYNNRVTQYGLSGKSTLLDYNMQLLEIEIASSRLEQTDMALDVCGGNGVSTLALAKHCKPVTGFGLSQKMIETAQKSLSSRKSASRNIFFNTGNVLNSDKIYAPGRFNAVVSVRGLINLPSWKLQQRAILNIHKILPRGGKFIFIEGSADGLRNINKLREKFSLPPLKEPGYDKHFETSTLPEFMTKYFNSRASKNLDTYFLISRIFYPLATLPDKPEFDSVCNTVAKLTVPYVQTDTNTTLLICRYFTKK